jgi:hypothetical protein
VKKKAGTPVSSRSLSGFEPPKGQSNSVSREYPERAGTKRRQERATGTQKCSIRVHAVVGGPRRFFSIKPLTQVKRVKPFIPSLIHCALEIIAVL